MSNIEFVSTIKGLESIEECLPRPAKNFMPKWFKDVPRNLTPEQQYVPGAVNALGVSTVKTCPSFPDYFSLGYILPMWCDSKINYDQETKNFSWSTSSDIFHWDVHANSQFLDWSNAKFMGSPTQFIFKPECPWRIITPKGWSVLQLPLFYHFEQNWSVMPGVIDTDIINKFDQPVLYHGDGKEVQINRGDPFALYIPYERKSKLDLEIRYQNKKDENLFNKQKINLASKFVPNGLYKKWQRERDKGL
jgi:hypothetical protein